MVVEWNFISIVFGIVFLLQLAFAIGMEMLNRRHLVEKGSDIPESMKEYVDRDKLMRMNQYNLDTSNLHIIKKLTGDSLLLAAILFGLFPWVGGFFTSYSYVVAGLCFFLALGTISFALDLPFDYYATFILEEKYGFNRTDIKTWLLDNVKSIGISAVFAAIIIGPLLWSIQFSPDYWWLLGFVIVAAIQFFLIILYPVLIAPLFNKFEPLSDAELAEKIETLVRETGMRTEGIFRMDAGKRSTHSNAYFTGLGKTKRVVLFDTLIDTHTQDEILGVLAHELGHFKMNHVLKSYLLSLATTLILFYATYLVLNWPLMYETFHLNPVSNYVALVIVAIFWRKAGYFLRPVGAAISRRFERSADAFALRLLMNSAPLATALKKLAGHNLSNLNPHPFYVWFYYSHPPLRERVEYLESAGI